MKKIPLILIFVCVINLFSFGNIGSANSGELQYVIFQNDFENETVGVRPASTSDNDPLLWTGFNHVRNPYQVVVVSSDENKLLCLRRNEGETVYVKPAIVKKLIVTDDCSINIRFKLRLNLQEFELQCYDPERVCVSKAIDLPEGDKIFEAFEKASDDGFVCLNVRINFSDLSYCTTYPDGSVLQSGFLRDETDISDGYMIRFQAMPDEGKEVYLDEVCVTTDRAELLGMKLVDLSSLESDNELLSSVKESHPRIYVDDFDDIKKKISSDAMAKAWYDRIKASADNYVSTNSVEEYNPSSSTALATARRIRYKLHILSFMYAMTGNEDYKALAYNQIVAAGSFPNWNGYLHSAEISGGIAVAYDWMYNSFTDTEKETVCNIMYDKGFYYAVLSYMGISDTTFVNSASNQNMACNSCYMLAALAFSDEMRDICGFVLDNGVCSIKTGLSILAPEGASPEGTGYWDYSLTNVFQLAAAIESSVKDANNISAEYDIASYPGLDNTLYYPIYMQNKNGIFNYGDADNINQDYYDFSFAYWAAEKYDNSEFYRYQYDNVDSKGNYGTAWKLIHKLVYYNPLSFEGFETELTPDKSFSGENASVATMRTSWNGNGFFAGIQGGSGTVKHMYQSYGNFVLDYNGVRFATMRGRGDYDWPGYFDMTQQKWQYYISRTEGQNCVVLNPDEAAGQVIGSEARIDEFCSETDEAYAVMNLTNAYDVNAYSYLRGIRLFNERNSVLLQDDIVADSVINSGWWFMHTDSEIEISEDGRTAKLVRDGQTIYAKIITPGEELKFSVMSAKPLPTSPNPAVQQEVDYGAKLAIELNDIKNINLAVLFTPEKEFRISEDDIVPVRYWGNEPEKDNMFSYSVHGEELNKNDIIFEDGFDYFPSVSFHKYGYTSSLGTSRYAISDFGNTENTIDNGYINTNFDLNRRFLEFVCKKYCDTPYILGAKLSPAPDALTGKYGSYVIEFDVLPESAGEISFFLRSSSFKRVEAFQINGSSAGEGNYDNENAYGPVLKGVSGKGDADYEYLKENIISDSQKWHKVMIIVNLDEFTVTSFVNGFITRKLTEDDFITLGNENPGWLDIIEFRVSAVMGDETSFGLDNLKIRKAGERYHVSDVLMYDGSYSAENIAGSLSGYNTVFTRSIINESQSPVNITVATAAYSGNSLSDINFENKVIESASCRFFRHNMATEENLSNVKTFVWNNLCPVEIYDEFVK